MRFRLAAALVMLSLLGVAGCQARAGGSPVQSRAVVVNSATSTVETGMPDGAWPIAKAAAVRIAMGQSPGNGVPANRDFFDRLRHPRDQDYVRVWTPREDNFIRNDNGTLQVNFIVQNLQDESIPMVACYVVLRPTASGWKVDGFGHAP